MLGKIFDAFSGKKTLLDEALQDSVMMLVSVQRMYDLVMIAIKDEAGQHIRDKIATMDKEINRQQREVRRKVFEHLSLSRGQDLLLSLEVVTAVIDIERVGDYTKNISELVEMMPGKLCFGEYEEVYDKAQRLSGEVFNLCVDAFARNDLDAARKCMEQYQHLSHLCDRNVEQLLKDEGHEQIPKGQVALVLMLRYLKRVGAHLKNVASVKVNPFHRIGYRPKT